MPELLKNMLNYNSLSEFALAIKSVYSSFAVEEFLASVMDKTWDSLELKARGRQITINLGRYLPADYKEAIGVLDKVAPIYKGWGLFCFPDFVEVFGQDEKNWDISVNALERYTPYASAEWAVRPFIIKHEKRMMDRVYEWSKHKNEHVRRLSSEGCRPALPWSIALTKFKKDPSPILPILERLKTDPSLYVRRSVANNLNDISKTHPDLMIKIARDWYGKNEDTNWIVKHGCRTLLKKGNREVLAIFGYDDVTSIEVSDFSLATTALKIGEDTTFAFSIQAKEPTEARLEYGIDYVKSKGKRNRKIFQISEITLEKNEKKHYRRKLSFKDMSTRKHYSGMHSIGLIVNGVERGKLDFELEK
ncbi:DNA alkylation repair protein [Microgenomates group bacterium]|nr:DNA alkylation repair protein [Microgenomates group bacterium]